MSGKFKKFFFILAVLFCGLGLFSLISAQEPDKDKKEIQLFPGQTQVLQGENIQRVLSSDTSVVTIRLVTPKEVEITAVSLGNAFIHYWDKNGRNTFRVIVTRIITEEEIKREKQLAGAWFSDFRLSYTGTMNNTYIHNYNPESDLTSQLQTHTFTLGTSLPLGRFQNYYHFQGVNNYLYLTDWWAYLFNPDYKLGVGDLSTSLSELTGSGISFQGVHFNSSFNQWKYGLDWGARNKPYWGGATGLSPDSFIGFRTDLPRFLYSDWEFVTGQTRDTAGNLENRVFGLVSRSDLGQWKVVSELAKSQSGRAFKSEAILAGPNYNFSGILRNIGSNHQALGGGVSYVGVTGIFLKGDYKPYEKVTLFSYYDYYYNFTGANPQKLNYPNTNLGLGLGYDFSPWPFFSLGYSRSDSQGYLSGGVSDGVYAGLSQTLDWIWKFNGYLRYGVTNFDLPMTPQDSYQSQVKSVGLNVGLTPSVYLILDRTYDVKQMKLSGSETWQRLDRAEAYWRDSVGETPLYFSFNAGYQASKSNDINRDYRQYYGAASLSYYLSRDLQFSLGGRVAETRSDATQALNRNEKSLYGSVTYVFDTAYGKLPRNLGGLVFEDINKNGLYDSLEPGLAGVTVVGNDKFFTKSEQNGEYSLSGLDVSRVTLKIKEEDLIGCQLSKPEILNVGVNPGEAKTVNIGLIPKTAYKGYVYEDANANGRLDLTERKFPGVAVVFDETKSATTNMDGYFLGGVKAGRHLVMVNAGTLPKNYLPVNAEGVTLEVKENEIKEINLAVINIRSLSGVFFIDKNFNRIFDKEKGEAGVSGVEVTFDEKSIISGQDGSFMLKEISTGAHQLTVKLPAPANLEEKYKVIIEKDAPDKIIVNFAVSPKLNSVQPLFDPRQIKISSARPQTQTGIIAGPLPEELIKVELFPVVPQKGRDLKIEVGIPTDIQVKKVTAVFPDKVVHFKYQKISGGDQIWQGIYRVPKSLRSNELSFKIFVKAKNFQFPVKKVSVALGEGKEGEKVAEKKPAPAAREKAGVPAEKKPTAPAKPAAPKKPGAKPTPKKITARPAPAAIAPKPIALKDFQVRFYPEVPRGGKDLKIQVLVDKDCSVKKASAVFTESIELKFVKEEAGLEIWEGVYKVRPDARAVNFKIFVKSENLTMPVKNFSLDVKK